jgi:hypothetical protein
MWPNMAVLDQSTASSPRDAPENREGVNGSFPLKSSHFPAFTPLPWFARV